jgi:23S rRNA (uridine2552-2'-O)-methyltransferase
MKKNFIVQDAYFHKAKKEGYVARSVFKLEEIQEKFRLMKRGSRVLDLGCYPGSWLQFVLKTVGEKSVVVGCDLQSMDQVKAENLHTIQADVFDEKTLERIQRIVPIFDVILSDMAPKTSGIKDVDQYQSVLIGIQALNLAGKTLKQGGNMAVKIFMGADFQDFWGFFKKYFKQAKTYKPKAVRPGSYEVYAVGIGFEKDLFEEIEV